MGKLEKTLKLLLIFWLVSVVLVESAHQKRDVHHRIVLQEPRPMRNHRPKHTKHHRHLEERPKKSKKKPHKYADSREEAFSHPSDDSTYEEFFKQQTKSKRHHHSSHHKSPKSSSKYHPKVTYHYEDSSEPSTAYHENFKENVHHFEDIESSKPPKWPGPLSGSNEYFLSSPKEASYIENKPGKELPKDYKYSSERFEYQQPSKTTFQYYKNPVEFTTEYPKRHTHNYEFDASESNSYKPFSTSFQQFESNKKAMEASPLITTTENDGKTFSSGAVKRDVKPKFEHFKLTEASSNTSPTFKIIVDNFETTTENSDEDADNKKKDGNVSKDKKRRPSRNKKNKQKGNLKYAHHQVHKIKKTVYE